jgi:hypothetical protein
VCSTPITPQNRGHPIYPELTLIKNKNGQVDNHLPIPSQEKETYVFASLVLSFNPVVPSLYGFWQTVLWAVLVVKHHL